jgi:transposase-like protein
LNLSDPRFQDAEKAREWFEAQRWPNGTICPHCENADPAKISGLEGKIYRPGLYYCVECQQQFTVTVGCIMERSRIALNKWLLAIYLVGGSKKGISVRQLSRMLGIAYQSAWFLAQRIREAKRTLPVRLGKSSKPTKPILAKSRNQKFPRGPRAARTKSVRSAR